MLQLSDNSAHALGVVTALQFTPVLLLTLYGGKLADRYDKRKLIIAANFVFSGLALFLGLLVATDHVTLHWVFFTAALMGVVNAIETPVRQSFVSEMVPPGAAAQRAVAVGGDVQHRAHHRPGDRRRRHRPDRAVPGLPAQHAGVPVADRRCCCGCVPSELHREPRGRRPGRPDPGGGALRVAAQRPAAADPADARDRRGRLQLHAHAAAAGQERLPHRSVPVRAAHAPRSRSARWSARSPAAAAGPGPACTSCSGPRSGSARSSW